MKLYTTLCPALLSLLLASNAIAQITSFCPAQANSTGPGAALTGYLGSGAGIGLHLEVSGGPIGEFGYFVVGDEATPPVAVGNGNLCLTGTSTSHIYRFNVGLGSEWYSVGHFDSSGVLQNLGGTSTIGSGYDVPPTIPDSLPIAINYGATWHFQLWYRDGAIGPGSSNFSNGLSVVFQPPGTPIPGMVAIPAGHFEMGSDALVGAPYFGSQNEQPVHPVSISYGFWMGQYEVIQLDYQALMGINPSYYPGILDHPVERVTWDDARAYCAALTAQQVALGNVPSGYEYRLPTEAEWEYACRAGTTTEYNTGVSLLCASARFDGRYAASVPCLNAPDGTGPVGSFAPNAFGLYDMHGNVNEWCLDSWSAYSGGAETDPFTTSPTGGTRMVRGGSFNSSDFACRSAIRGTFTSSGKADSIGFRVVLAPVIVP